LSFIIAEIGVNWDGDFNLVEDMMIHAKNADCNAVKFQAFNKNIIGNHPEYERLMKTSISESNIEKIDNLAQKIGIEWFCTPMYPEAIDFLTPYVKRFKIREFDSRKLLENKTTDLMEKILETDKEIIISSQNSPENSKLYNNSKIKWLYCVPKYPCNLEDIDFSELEKFDGFSNHCPQLIAPLSAAIRGAEIIEIHITSSKEKNFVDNNVSFDYNELTDTIKAIRLSEKIKR
jgi:N,N'-diacetyllegionaminate synthase